MDDKMKISIKDNGKGMPPEVREHIFEPFFTTRTVGEGTGLGLSISYSIIEEHKGVIEVYSEPDEGTEFIIILPFSSPAWKLHQPNNPLGNRGLFGSVWSELYLGAIFWLTLKKFSGSYFSLILASLE